MDHTEHTENTALRGVVGDFISSYAKRDTTVSFSSWLSERLCQELPDLTPEASTKLTAEIMAAVDSYDKTLQNLNSAIDAGQSREEWLTDQIVDAYEDMPPEAAGEALQHMEAELLASNMQLMGKIDPAQVSGLSITETEATDWNKYSLKAKAYDIGQQVNALMLSSAANALDQWAQGDEVDFNTAISDGIRSGMRSSPEEVKAMVAGAVHVSAERGLTDLLPPGTSIEVIGDLAGAAVEGAEALCDAANGNITLTEAMDRTGRAGVAACCRVGARSLRKKLNNLPGGPILTDLLGGLLDHMESPKFAKNVYTTVRDTAIATWEGVKNSKAVTTVKAVGKKLWQFLFG